MGSPRPAGVQEQRSCPPVRVALTGPRSPLASSPEVQAPSARPRPSVSHCPPTTAGRKRAVCGSSASFDREPTLCPELHEVLWLLQRTVQTGVASAPRASGKGQRDTRQTVSSVRRPSRCSGNIWGPGATPQAEIEDGRPVCARACVHVRASVCTCVRVHARVCVREMQHGAGLLPSAAERAS